MDHDNIAIVVDGCAAEVAQPFDAPDVLRLGGLLGDGIVIRVDGGRASRFAPAEPVSFEVGARPEFRTFRGAAHVLWVDGLRWDWGSPVISSADIRLVGRIDSAAAIAVEGRDVPLRVGELVDLTTERPPRLRTRSCGDDLLVARKGEPVCRGSRGDVVAGTERRMLPEPAGPPSSPLSRTSR